MKLKQRKLKRIKPFRECSNCGKVTDTRTLNVRYQDFILTYKSTKYNPNRQNFWIYNTKGYDLCKPCQKKLLEKLSKI